MSLKKKSKKGLIGDSTESANAEDNWLLTYSDMITLLLAFFVVLIAVSQFDINLWDQLQQGLRSEMAGQEQVRTPLAEVKLDLENLLEEERQEGLVDILLDREGIKMFFESSSFYASGGAEILPRGQTIVDKVVQALNAIDFYKFNVDVEGHTDNVPISTLQFPSNWELSVARASNVVRYFINEGLEPERLKASGYADTQPVAPNQDEFGNAIPSNQALNRRVVIRVYY